MLKDVVEHPIHNAEDGYEETRRAARVRRGCHNRTGTAGGREFSPDRSNCSTTRASAFTDPHQRRRPLDTDLIQQPAETVRSLWEIRCAIEVTAFAAIQGGSIEANAITLRELQFHQIEPILDRLRGALAALAHGQQPPAFDVRVVFSFGIDWDTDGTFDIQDRTDEIVDGFLWGVLKTLREARRDIRLCARPKCGTPYVKSTAGLYHSAACSQRVRTDKWLGRKREEAPKGKTTTTKLGRRRGK